MKAGKPARAIDRHCAITSVSCRKRFSIGKFDKIFDFDLAPPLRLAVVIQPIWEQRPNVRREIRRAAFHIRARGAEIDEPVLEDRPRHRFERFVHTAVEVDLVVKRAEDGPNRSFYCAEPWNFQCF